jgi:hypothetical protein
VLSGQYYDAESGLHYNVTREDRPMEDTIIEQGPGYTIATVKEAHGVVPYGSFVREDGTNHGWVDLRDQPGLADRIPEARNLPGMQAILRAANGPQSPLMSIGCEKGLFPVDGHHLITHMVGGYIDLVFRTGDRNDPDQLVEVARLILSKMGSAPPGVFTGYEFLVQPLKSFFGEGGRYALMLKPQGFGEDETAAWKAFEVACMYVANALHGYIEEFQSASGQR